MRLNGGREMKLIRYTVIIVFCLSLGFFLAAKGKKLISKDSNLPTITSDRDVLEIPCKYTQEQLLDGLNASDKEDGDLTNKILVGNMTRFIDKGLCNVTYVVFDSSNQSASLTRNVRFTDYRSSRFITAKPLVYVEKEGNYQKTISQITAEDMLDGDLTESIIQGSSDVNYSVAGSYHLTLEVSNSFGDVNTMEIPIHIVKSENQSINIELTEGIVYINAGETIDPYQYIENVETISERKVNKKNDTIDSQVDINTPGIYEIHYSVVSSGNKGETWLTVVVE